ncbi:Small GTPase superfamily, ARF/SAR type [Dillenia turbinata]|uniref:Small GTPase superfamily, ARF/SAR type n=1 Tax=Dillenia turbinata TaxID=194707 RepID=A0AAN8Z4U8_9MAGN
MERTPAYTLNIWDIGGQRTIRSYWRNYFEQTDGLVWVVDSSDLRRLDDCKMELDNLLKEERLSGASLLILANKQDIQGVLTPAEIGKVLNLDAMDKTRHWKIVGCSAYTGEGLLEGFDWLVQDIASRIYHTMLGLKQNTRTAGGTVNSTSWLYPNLRNKSRPSASALALNPTPTIFKNRKNLASIGVAKSGTTNTKDCHTGEYIYYKKRPKFSRGKCGEEKVVPPGGIQVGYKDFKGEDKVVKWN